jgi:ribosomal protein L11 methyltransferase
MKRYVQFEIKEDNQEKKEIIIATLSALGFDGFEESNEGVLASGTEGEADATEATTWLNGLGVSFQQNLLEDQNWNALWESNFSPVVVDDFAGVRAHFHAPNSHVKYDLLITPKMSFGTGHHATTRQMISLMRDLPIAGARVFDFGTGTGVLALLAAKMGAADVEAIDNDDWSIANAAENFAANSVRGINLYLADNLSGVAPAEIVLANINKHIILSFLPELKALVKNGGYLLLSGLMSADEEDIDLALEGSYFTKVKTSELSGWIALLFERNDG